MICDDIYIPGGWDRNKNKTVPCGSLCDAMRNNSRYLSAQDYILYMKRTIFTRKNTTILL